MFALAGTDPSLLEKLLGWLHDPADLLQTMGPWVLWGTMLIVLIESGVLFPLLPGDSLLFTAGLLHEQLGINLFVLVLGVFVAAFIGAQIGYWLGAVYGRRFFTADARILKLEHLEKAEAYFAKYGGRSLVIGRFVPFIRTFVPLAAGMARYPYGQFVVFNSLGAALWGVGVTLAGVALGGFDFVKNNLSVIILAIVVVSVIPVVVEVVLHKIRAGKEEDK